MKKVKAKNIIWDIDLEDDETYDDAVIELGLPNEVEIPSHIGFDPDDVSDYLSDKYEFCNYGFDLVKE